MWQVTKSIGGLLLLKLCPSLKFQFYYLYILHLQQYFVSFLFQIFTNESRAIVIILQMIFWDSYYFSTMENKIALIYIAWSNLYLPFLILYILLQEKYLDFIDASKVLTYFYLLIITEILNAVSFKIAFGITQNSNKKLIQGILSKLCCIKISDLVQTLLCVAPSVLSFAFLAITFGASVVSNYEQTLIFSSLLSILTILPACIHFNAQSAILLLITGQYSSTLNQNQQNFVLQRFYCTMLGAWLGAFVIPLDWGRDWQAWPVPCCMGALVGTSVGQLVSLVQWNDVIHQYRTRPGLLGKTSKRSR